ncbi:peptidylprolyl isomerase, partial [bacterium]
MIGKLGNDRVVPFLEKVLVRSDYDVAVETAELLNQITGQTYTHLLPQRVLPVISEDDWIQLEKIEPRQRARISTSQGPIVIELLKEHAPLTVLNFYKLIRQGFYDGRTFHRVVPDFVVQGG